jgi:hypothetical protein
MAPARRWSEAEDEILANLWPRLSASKIGAVLGVSRHAVIGRYHRLIGTSFPSDAERQGRATRAKIQRHQGTIARRLAQAEEIAMWRAAGYQYWRIGQILGVSESAAWRREQRARLHEHSDSRR